MLFTVNYCCKRPTWVIEVALTPWSAPDPTLAAIAMAGLTSAYVSLLFAYTLSRFEANLQIVLSPHHRSHRWHRTLTFIALGLSSIVPVAHVILTRGIVYARMHLSFDLTILSGASYIVGAVL